MYPLQVSYCELVSVFACLAVFTRYTRTKVRLATLGIATRAAGITEPVRADHQSGRWRQEAYEVSDMRWRIAARDRQGREARHSAGSGLLRVLRQRGRNTAGIGTARYIRRHDGSAGNPVHRHQQR